MKATSYLTISMLGQREAGKIQRNIITITGIDDTAKRGGWPASVLLP